MIKSRLNQKIKNQIIGKIDNFYKKRLSIIFRYSSQNNVGGKIRQSMGDLVEGLSTLAWTEVAKIYANITKPITPKRGENNQIKCVNEDDHSFNAHVDRHCYIDSKFVLAIESKSYLDSCYYYRASNDFRLLKLYFNKELICIVISIEDATKEESKKFIEDEKWVDRAFILADGKRTSAKPIWKKEFRKKLNSAKVGDLIEFIDNIFCENLSVK